MIAIEDIEAPSIEPVDLAYAKTFLRIDSDIEDTLIADIIVSARIRVENLIRQSLICRSRLYSTDVTDQNRIDIDHAPVQSISEVRLLDINAQIIQIPLTDLDINLSRHPPSIHVRRGQTFRSYTPAGCQLQIVLEAGYGMTPVQVPMPLRQAVLLWLAQSYEHRDPAQSSAPPLMVEALLMPYRKYRV